MGNTCRLQIWFRSKLGNTEFPALRLTNRLRLYGLAYTNADMTYCLAQITGSPNYGTVMYHAQLPRDQWIYMPVTNIVNNSGIGLQDDLPTNTLPDGVFHGADKYNAAGP